MGSKRRDSNSRFKYNTILPKHVGETGGVSGVRKRVGIARRANKREVGSESAGACTKPGGWRNINGERRTIPQLVSTLSRQNQCDLNLLHPLQHPLDRSTSPRACLAGWLAGWPRPFSLSELPLHVEFHYRKQSAAPLYGVCAKFTDHGYKLLLLSFPLFSFYFFFFFFFYLHAPLLWGISFVLPFF